MSRRSLLFCLLVLGAGLLLGACGSGNTSGPSYGEIALDTNTTFRVGDAKRVQSDEAVLKLEEVVKDTRCGTEEACLTAGEFVVRVRVFKDNTEGITVLVPWGNPSPVPISGQQGRYQIHITNVEPSKRSISDSIPQEQYKITFRLTRI